MSENNNLPVLIGAVDQGTSSSRFLIFNGLTGELITFAQKEIKMICPQQSWVEIDPKEILQSVLDCIEEALGKLEANGYSKRQLAAVGITNQRETTITWDKVTGEPLHNAIVWLDGRTTSLAQELIEKCPGKSKDALRHSCGLPIHPYFSALKLRWMIDCVPRVKQAITNNTCLAGTVDTWLIWNLTGRSVHCTDCTNASRTMLMNLRTLNWDQTLLEFFEIPVEVLPAIRSSAEVYGEIKEGPLAGVPIAGCLGDQQAALVGSDCLAPYTAKNTYGTGCFMLFNTGPELIQSEHGLLSTVAFKFGANGRPFYALEGSIAVAGLAVRWLRDNLKIIERSEQVEQLAREVDGSHGVTFVPAFSGLYAPYWRPDARGLICGLSQYSTKAHIARATLEAACFQSLDILEATQKDICKVCASSKSDRMLLNELKADGGMAANDLVLQIQADLLGIPVVRQEMLESTALGAAIAASLAIGAIKSADQFFRSKPVSRISTFRPALTELERSSMIEGWRKAIKRTLL